MLRQEKAKIQLIQNAFFLLKFTAIYAHIFVVERHHLKHVVLRK